MDPRMKRPHETHWAWRSRLIAQAQQERDKAEPLITKQTERHGDYDDEFVMHVETGTQVRTKRNRGISSLVRMHNSGHLDNAQYEAALRIARIAENIERAVSVRCASLEARIDCSCAGRDALVEHLARVRDEIAYSRWRIRIPLPRRMILDMILVDRPLATTARMYGMRWETRGGRKGARDLFIGALDLWCDLRERVGKDVDESDLGRAHARIAA